mmetsp:Transcript_41752/g.126668  ORF Transcript_41752/g.126668 Transcript_41752/m.126668 type:complete len:103 (-) Transcript_41752:48-356(-)
MYHPPPSLGLRISDGDPLLKKPEHENDRPSFIVLLEGKMLSMQSCLIMDVVENSPNLSVLIISVLNQQHIDQRHVRFTAKSKDQQKMLCTLARGSAQVQTAR